MTEITLENYKQIKRYLKNDGEMSCENSFVNLLAWQKAYNNCFKLYDDCFILYSKFNGKSIYRLPFCDNFESGFRHIVKLNGNKLPHIWAQDGSSFQKFKSIYKNEYDFYENRDAFDYIYSRDDLATLSGKKYHSKRNHISAFSKKYNWEYRKITSDLVDSVKKCAERWYCENEDKSDKYIEVEHKAIATILNNMSSLNVRGGAIIVEGEVVAFTLGSPINDTVFDVHIEKALSDYSEAYAVINREFVKNELVEYRYINREDDMGLEGLRKAKLSYKPEILLKKYRCIPKGDVFEY